MNLKYKKSITIIMVIIMEDLVWEIFKKTGDIKYYLLAKKLIL